MEGKLLKGLASCFVSADNINLSNLFNSNDKMLFFEASHHSTRFYTLLKIMELPARNLSRYGR